MMREVLTRRFKRLLKEHGLPAGEAAANDEAHHPLTLSLSQWERGGPLNGHAGTPSPMGRGGGEG